MSKKEPNLPKITKAIRDLLIEHPEGLDIHQIRELLEIPPNTQEHFTRRLRDLYPYYRIERRRDSKRTVYVFQGERPEGEWGFSVVSSKDRARVLNNAGGRCQMCGMTIADDCVKLVIDHKIPQSWNGPSDIWNLWAICSACNEGKKNYFKTFDEDTMREVMGPDSVHERIFALLHLKKGEWVDSDLLGFVANFKDYQEDWQKRLRELRLLGCDIPKPKKGKRGKRTTSFYRLNNCPEDLPEDLTAAIRQKERDRVAKKRSKKGQ